MPRRLPTESGIHLLGDFQFFGVRSGVWVPPSGFLLHTPFYKFLVADLTKVLKLCLRSGTRRRGQATHQRNSSNSCRNGTYRKVSANPAGLWLRRDRHQERGRPECVCENTSKINAANGFCRRGILPGALEQTDGPTLPATLGILTGPGDREGFFFLVRLGEPIRQRLADEDWNSACPPLESGLRNSQSVGCGGCRPHPLP